MLAHCNLKQNTWLCSKQSSFFSFYALPSGGKSKDAVVHYNVLALFTFYALPSGGKSKDAVVHILQCASIVYLLCSAL